MYGGISSVLCKLEKPVHKATYYKIPFILYPGKSKTVKTQYTSMIVKD